MDEPARRERLLRDCLATFEHVRLRVRGACMQPAAEEGARVRLVAASRRRPRFGDVVLVRAREGLRLHRLVWPPAGADGGRLRTMADRARSLDAALDARDVLGVVTHVEHATGTRLGRDRGRALRGLLRVAFTRLARLRARRA